MNSGMLWFDDRDIPLTMKVEDARKHFLQTRGYHARCCEVSDKETFIPDPTDIRLITGDLEDPGITSIEPKRNILPNHLLLGPT